MKTHTMRWQNRFEINGEFAENIHRKMFVLKNEPKHVQKKINVVEN